MMTGDTFEMTDFPADAIADCSGPGPADDAVEFWVEELDFRPDPEAMRRCLKEYGAWDAAELADDEENRRRVFWIMMNDFAEWDGKPAHESNYGADVFYLGI